MTTEEKHVFFLEDTRPRPVFSFYRLTMGDLSFSCVKISVNQEKRVFDWDELYIIKRNFSVSSLLVAMELNLRFFSAAGRKKDGERGCRRCASFSAANLLQREASERVWKLQNQPFGRRRTDERLFLQSVTSMCKSTKANQIIKSSVSSCVMDFLDMIIYYFADFFLTSLSSFFIPIDPHFKATIRPSVTRIRCLT